MQIYCLYCSRILYKKIVIINVTGLDLLILYLIVTLFFLLYPFICITWYQPFTNYKSQKKKMTIPNANKNPNIWATLITNSNYLQGVLTLDYSLKKYNSAYPLIALYTDQLDSATLDILHNHQIPTLKIENLSPKTDVESITKNLIHDKRFLDTWSKLYFFKLTQFKRIIQLDSDILILQNIDELMSLPLYNYRFAATHACVCNPLKKSHYPSNWTRKNCAFTHSVDSYNVPNAEFGLAKCNSGLLIVEPSLDSFNQILSYLNNSEKVQSYLFPDQDLLADVFYQNWLSIPPIYNCLKTYKNCHPQFWDLSKIKIIHYILSPKPWDVNSTSYNDNSETFHLWWNENDERLQLENNNQRNTPL